MLTSQNGYPVLTTNRTAGSLPRLRKWIIPGTNRHVFLRDGSVGFVLVHLALWFHEVIEKIDVGVWDDWGWAVRPVRGQTSGYSNHAAGAAVDLNATLHPRGRSLATFRLVAQVVKIRARLAFYGGVIGWGGDYQHSPVDGMHFEVVKGMAATQALARWLSRTPRGRRILAANPGAAAVIWDGRVPTDTPAPPAPKPTPTTPPPPPVPTAPTPERLAIDYSYAKGKMRPAAIKAAGFHGVARYLSGNAKKDLTRAEADALLDAGLWIILIWELRAARAGEGRAAGVADAKAAEAQADALGVPLDAAILYAVDYDASPAEVRAYFEGIHSAAKRPVGIYGSARIIDAGLAAHGWQTMGWSKGAISSKAKLIQRTTHSRTIAGASASDWDENLIVPGKVIPAWRPHKAAPTPAPTPAPQSKRTLRVGTYNALRGRPVSVVRDELVRLCADLDVLAVQECNGYAAALRDVPGFQLIAFYDVREQGESVILVRDGLKVSHQGVTQVTSDPDGKGPLIAGWLTATGGKTPAKWATSVEVEGAAFVSLHTPPTVQTAAQRVAAPRRWRAYRNLMASLVALVGRLAAGTVVVAGDWNVDARTDTGSPAEFPKAVLEGQLRMTRAFPPTGTAGKRTIDGFGVRGGTLSNVRALPGYGSDHQPVIATLTY